METLLFHLQQIGWIRTSTARCTPLTGGVSCDILLIEEEGRRFVLKQALAKLRVKADWFADVERNHFEQAYLSVVGEIVPGKVPKVLHADRERGFFLMEYLGEGWENWKNRLLCGRTNAPEAALAGESLGVIHSRTWGDPRLASEFNTTENFIKLRIDPYLRTTGQKHPSLCSFFEQEATRLEQTTQALVHGDFSPKNLLLQPDGLMILDCEVAWFGDPLFDVAFFLNHLLLKAWLLPEHAEGFDLMARAFLNSYRTAMGSKFGAIEEKQAVRLLLMLMLARIDGKSPVEYFTENVVAQCRIRDFVSQHLPDPPPSLNALLMLLKQLRHSL